MTEHTQPVYSVTSLVIYRACPWQYYIQFVRRIPPPRSTARMRGTSVHKLIADHLRQPQLLPAAPPEDVRVQFENFLSSRFNQPPALCETPFRLHFERGDVRGRIDSVFYGAGSGMEIVDYKSGTARTREALQTDIQLPLYALAVSRRYNLRAKDLAWTYFYLSDPAEVTFVGNDRTFPWLSSTVDDVMRSIEAGEFPSTPNCTCWACERWPPRRVTTDPA